MFGEVRREAKDELRRDKHRRKVKAKKDKLAERQGDREAARGWVGRQAWGIR